MTSDDRPDSTREARLEEVLAAYLRAVEAGPKPDHAAILAKHPDLADDLQSFFANHAAIGRMAQPLKNQGLDATIGFTPADGAPGNRLRYVGDYELLEEIARGGMGVVYRAKQKSLNRTVAV